MLGIIIEDQCEICKKEIAEKCKLEHPEWFTPKRKKLKVGCWINLEQYVVNNTPMKKCFVIENYAHYGEDEYEMSICTDHLREIYKSINENSLKTTQSEVT